MMIHDHHSGTAPLPHHDAEQYSADVTNSTFPPLPSLSSFYPIYASYTSPQPALPPLNSMLPSMSAPITTSVSSPRTLSNSSGFQSYSDLIRSITTPRLDYTQKVMRESSSSRGRRHRSENHPLQDDIAQKADYDNLSNTTAQALPSPKSHFLLSTSFTSHPPSSPIATLTQQPHHLPNNRRVIIPSQTAHLRASHYPHPRDRLSYSPARACNPTAYDAQLASSSSRNKNASLHNHIISAPPPVRFGGTTTKETYEEQKWQRSVVRAGREKKKKMQEIEEIIFRAGEAMTANRMNDANASLNKDEEFKSQIDSQSSDTILTPLQQWKHSQHLARLALEEQQRVEQEQRTRDAMIALKKRQARLAQEEAEREAKVREQEIVDAQEAERARQRDEVAAHKRAESMSIIALEFKKKRAEEESQRQAEIEREKQLAHILAVQVAAASQAGLTTFQQQTKSRQMKLAEVVKDVMIAESVVNGLTTTTTTSVGESVLSEEEESFRRADEIRARREEEIRRRAAEHTRAASEVRAKKQALDAEEERQRLVKEQAIYAERNMTFKPNAIPLLPPGQHQKRPSVFRRPSLFSSPASALTSPPLPMRALSISNDAATAKILKEIAAQAAENDANSKEESDSDS